MNVRYYWRLSNYCDRFADVPGLVYEFDSVQAMTEYLSGLNLGNIAYSESRRAIVEIFNH